MTATAWDREHDAAVAAERSVLGSILTDGTLFDVAAEHVTAADFARLEHRVLWTTLARMARQGATIDLVTAVHALGTDLADAGGAVYVSGLQDGVARASNVEAYAQLVHAYATKRAAHAAGRRIVADAESAEFDAEQLIESAERLVYGLRDRTLTVDVMTPARRASDAFQQINTLTGQRGGLTGVPTGIAALDGELRGLRPGNLVVVGARPSVGKSAFALTVAVQAARLTGQPALFLSLEMSAEELNLREVTMRARVDSWRLAHGRLSDAEHRSLADGLQQMQDGGVHVVDAPGLTVSRARGLARRHQAQHGLSVIVVDYLQLLASEGTRRTAENRTQEVSEQSRALKLLARELNVPVVVLSQLSRGVEARQDKRPMLSDLRESGAIEQDADVVLFLYRDRVYNPAADEREAEILIAKSRNGPTGMVKAAFLKEYTLFADWQTRTEAA